MLRFRVELSIALILTSASHILAQSAGQQSTALGEFPHETAFTSPFDKVDLADLGILVNVPIKNKQEMIPFSFKLMGQSSLVQGFHFNSSGTVDGAEWSLRAFGFGGVTGVPLGVTIGSGNASTG